jgi:hypothetical protein
LSTFKKGDLVDVQSESHPDWNGPAVVEKMYALGPSVHVVPKYGPHKGRRGSFNVAAVKLLEEEALGLVEFVNPDPTVSIDLKKLNSMYNTPLVLTIEQAAQLLRELDAVIL